MKQLKRIYHYLQQRYGSMWTLFIVTVVTLTAGILEFLELLENFQLPDGDKYVGWMHVCNALCLLVIDVQLLRLDCRRLLSRRTADILNTCGYSIILLMLIRNQLSRHVTSVDLNTTLFYSENVLFINLLGFVLIFCAEMVRRAVKIKEEQDLTI